MKPCFMGDGARLKLRAKSHNIIHMPDFRIQFLKEIWSDHKKGYVFLAASMHDGFWQERPFKIPIDWDLICNFLDEYQSTSHNIYFCPNAFRIAERKASFAFQTDMAWCDIDDADPNLFVPKPSILIKTSPNRFQGIWKLSGMVTARKAEALSKFLAYEFDADKNGWSITKYLRLPFTLNHKPQYDLPRVKLIDFTGKKHEPWPHEKLRKRLVFRSMDTVSTLNVEGVDWRLVLQKYKQKMKYRVRRLCETNVVDSLNKDRSTMIYIMIAGLVSAGASRNETAAVLFRNPYFLSKHGEDLRALENEIDRISNKLGVDHD